MRLFCSCLLVVVVLIAAGCQSAATATPTQAVQIALTIVPQPPTIGSATLNFTVTYADQPLAGVQVDVRANMTMPGMVPVLGSARTDVKGQLSLPVKWSMSGDWVVTVTVTLADKSQVSQDFTVTVKP